MTPTEELAKIRAATASPEASEWTEGERWGVELGYADWSAELAIEQNEFRGDSIRACASEMGSTPIPSTNITPATTTEPSTGAAPRERKIMQ